MKKWILSLIFFAYIKTPLGIERVYKDVVSYKVEGLSVILTRENGKTVVVPSLFTLIEER